MQLIPSVSPTGQRQPTGTPGTSAYAAANLVRVGERLHARRQEVARAAAERARETVLPTDEASERRLERTGVLATMAAARRMEGGGPPATHAQTQESWIIFTELAAQRALPLNGAIERFLHWRDAAEAAVREITTELGASPAVCAQALAALQRCLGVTLVQLGEAFEAERRREESERGRRERELAFAATHDPLTRLPNRALILDRLEQMLARARHDHAPVAALFIDLDDFKAINDSHGHEVGDELLQAVAARLAGAVRDVDTLGRLGGDEFVLLAEVSPAEGPEIMAERVLRAFAAPFALGGARPLAINITASVGVETDVGSSPGELLRDADVAMYRAKRAGKNRYVTLERRSSDAREDRRQRAGERPIGRATRGGAPATR